MLATINETFEVVFLSIEDDETQFISEIEEESRELFNEGDEVEILKVVDDATYDGGKAYVVFNPRNNGCATIHDGFLTFK